MDKTLEKARKDWVGVHKNAMNAVATMGWVGKDGETTFITGACHASLSSSYWFTPWKGLISVFSGIQRNHTGVEDKEEQERTFIEWLLFHSPFKNAFLKDTTAEALKHRVLMGDIEQPANVMGAGLMSTRIFNEHPRSLHMWWEFVKNGVHPSVAFVFAHRLYIDKEGKVQSHIPVHTGCFNGGLQISPYAGVKNVSINEYLLNFLQGKQFNKEQPYKEGPAGATNSFKLWAGANKEAKGLPPIEEVSNLLAKVVSPPTASKNPFAKAQALPAGAPAPTVERAMEVLVPHFEKYKEFF